MFEKICEYCGKPFQTRDAYDFRKRRFCCVSCSSKVNYPLLEVKPHGIKKEDTVGYETLFQLYVVERLTIRKIAKRLGFKSKGSIQNRLREYGIERREAQNGMVNRGLPEPTREELYHLVHEEHLGYREIAIMFGVTTIAITRRLDSYGIPRATYLDTYYKGNRPTLPTKEELESLYATGVSLTDIGEKYNVSEGVIRRCFKEFGIQVRPDGWGGKRFECKDGHIVRSIYEQRICDWLSEHDVPHIYEPPMPCDRRYHADFLANGWYIEVWGVTNNSIYEARRKKKVQLYHLYNLPLIELNKDFFGSRARTRLDRRLSKVLSPVPIPLLEIL